MGTSGVDDATLALYLRIFKVFGQTLSEPGRCCSQMGRRYEVRNLVKAGAQITDRAIRVVVETR